MPSMSDSTPAAPAARVPAAPAAPAPAGSLPVVAPPALPSAERVVLAEATPGIEELFRFAREAELRVSSLRMTIEERLENARGPELHRHGSGSDTRARHA